MEEGEASRMTEVVEQPACVMQSMEKQALALFFQVWEGEERKLGAQVPIKHSSTTSQNWKAATHHVPAAEAFEIFMQNHRALCSLCIFYVYF